MSKPFKLILPITIFGLALSFLIKPGGPGTSAPTTPAPTHKESPMPSANHQTYSQAQPVLEEGRGYNATLTTSLGEIIIELDTVNTPQTANNFAFLAQQGFYDQTIFHRVIPGFMIQGGDPTGTGSGGPGYRFPDEYLAGEYRRGTVAMANAGPDTNGSQFFIMHADYPLPNHYVIFGQVVKGLEIVDAIATVPTIQDGRENSRPISPPQILSVSITAR